MSMYAEYIKERLNDSIVEREEGFATYRFIDQEGVPCVYIVDIYVKKDFRKTKVASEMADEIVKMGASAGCKKLLGTVVPTAKGSTDSLRVLLGYGMSLSSSKDNLIIFEKEI